MYLKITKITIALFVFCYTAKSQDTVLENWFNLDLKEDGIRGISTEKAYNELLKNRKSTSVIVAVIDSGVEPDHSDLKNVMWINTKEIKGNNKDDDGNLHIDDINGWSFIGGKNGDVNNDTYEVTRLYAKHKDQYTNVNPLELNKKELNKYNQFKKYENDWKNAFEKAERNVKKFKETQTTIDNAFISLKNELGANNFNTEYLLTIDPKDDQGLATALGISLNYLQENHETTLKQIEDDINKQIQGTLDHYSNQLKYAYNINFDTRDIVGDNWENVYEKNYGNNQIKGPDAEHGTHVAGIIAAERNNNIGINGVANDVKIISVRTVPNGDERDKDVANAIIYATDMGAKVINMSFGKGASPRKIAVDKAVRYAEKHDVLFVHAAGNAAEDIDIENHFPEKKYLRNGLFGWGKKSAKNWIEVGASSWKPGKEMVATFSNYGRNEVDVFAPGVDIYSTVPDDSYGSFSGTSMAAPVTAGLAALIRSYFPSLSAIEVKQIILDSVVKIEYTVTIPGGEEEVPFTRLCKTGGVINAYNAIKLAITKTK